MKKLIVFFVLAIVAIQMIGITVQDQEPNNDEANRQLLPSNTTVVTGDVGPGDTADWFYMFIPAECELLADKEGDVNFFLANLAPEGDTRKVNIAVVYQSGGTTSYTLTFTQDCDTVPVELSSFTCQVTASNFVDLQWITQSESDMMGYNVLRNVEDDLTGALLQNGNMIPAQNQTDEHIYTFTDVEVEMDCMYWYWLESIENTGQSNMHGPVSVTLTPSQEPDGEDVDVAQITRLNPVYPNPFNPSANVSYYLSESSDVEISIYNVRGQKVRSFAKRLQSEGNHKFSWNGQDENGEIVGSGVYFFVMDTGSKTFVQKGIMLQ